MVIHFAVFPMNISSLEFNFADFELLYFTMHYQSVRVVGLVSLFRGNSSFRNSQNKSRAKFKAFTVLNNIKPKGQFCERFYTKLDEALEKCRPPWPRQIITPILHSIKICIEEKLTAEVLDHYEFICTSIGACHNYYDFCHLLIKENWDCHQNLMFFLVLPPDPSINFHCNRFITCSVMLQVI